MMPTEPTPALLLDYLYGLLDEAQQRQVDVLVKTMPEWRAALATARAHQGILSEAARATFPGVTFEAPAPGTDVREPEVTRVFQMPARRPWLRYALAASVLFVLVLGGGAVLSYNHYRQQMQLAQAEHDKLLQQQKELHSAYNSQEKSEQDEMRALQEKIKQLEIQWKGDRTKAVPANDAAQMRLTITGPKSVQAGALNQYQIETHHKKVLPGGTTQQSVAPTKIKARVVDPDLPKDKQVVFEKELESKGKVDLHLPPDLPVLPGKQLELQVVAEGEAGVKAAVSEKLPLVGALYMTHLTTDRPMYKPGDTIQFRSLTLQRFSLKPAAEPFELIFSLIQPNKERKEILRGTTHLQDINNVLLKGPDGQAISGIGAGNYVLAKDAAGGEWTLEVKEANNKFPTQSRKFLVNNYEAPRLNKEAEFTRKSYGPGDEVVVRLKVHRVDGNTPVQNQPVIPYVSVDNVKGIKVSPANPMTDAKGEVEIRFNLPGKGEIIDGSGVVALKCFDGQHHETISRPIPIVLNRLDVSFYPEGGDLIAGVPNRVYFEVKNKQGKPAELQGWLVDGKGADVLHQGKPVEVGTFHDDKEAGANQGLGAFEFIPKLGETYQVKIITPIGIEGKHLLPPAKKDGVVLSIAQGVITDKIDVTLYSADKERKLLVGAYCRGQMLAHSTVTVPAGKATPVTLKPADTVSGVYRITVFEYVEAPNKTHLVPTAERLIFRRPVEKLNFTIAPDKKTYAPGDPVKITINAKDEQSNAKPALVLVKVVNQSVVKLADDKTVHSMPTYFYLTTEIKSPDELEYADFLLNDEKDKKATAEKTLDLLLGTQGWRRFVEQSSEEELGKVTATKAAAGQAKTQPQTKDVERLLLLNGQNQPQKVDSANQAKVAVDTKYATEWVAKQQKLATAETKNVEHRQKFNEQKQTLNTQLRTATDAKESARANLNGQIQFLMQVALAVIATVLLLVGVFSLMIGLLRQADDSKKALPYMLIGGASLMLLFMLGGTALMYYGPMRGGATPTAVSDELAQRDKAKMAPADNALVADKMAAPPEPMEFGGAGGGNLAEVGPPKLNMAPGPKAAPPNVMPPQPVAPPLPTPPVAPGAQPALPDVPIAIAKQPVPPKGGAPGQPFFKGDQGNGKAGVEPGFNPQFGAAGMAMPDIAPGGPPMMPMPNPGFAGGGAMPADADWNGGPMGWQNEMALRQKGALLQLAKQKFGHQINLNELKKLLPPDPVPLIVREYAHQHAKSSDGVRRDFTETLFWHPALVLADGKGEITFDLSDSLSTFEVTVWGHSLDGRLGAGTKEFVSKLPFSVEPKVPFQISSTDKVTVPVTLTNDTDTQLPVKLLVKANNLDVIGDDNKTATVMPGAKLRQLFTFKANRPLADATLLFTGKCETFGSDSIEKTFQIVPEGFPFTKAYSDMLEGSATHTVNLPANVVKGSVQLRVQVFPSTMADLQKGLENMLQEPHGCFEQTSSSNYPNVMILSYMKETDQANGAVEKKARAMLDKGYAKLTSFECQPPQTDKRGYEWFGGQAAPHEALTAYGLLQFGDMQKVNFKVDPAMLERTEKFLLQQRDGKGGFTRNPAAIDSFGRAPQHLTDAYIVFALTEYGSKADLAKELQALKTRADSENDPYFLALVSLSLHNAGKSADALKVLNKLKDFQKDDGHLGGAKTSITSSGGRDLNIETTALGVLGWLRANRPADFNPSVQKAVQWIGKQRGGYGGFGSTQSTILALKALIAHAKENRKTAEPGEIKLYLNDEKQPVDTLSFPAGCTDELIVRVPSEALLNSGDNKVRVEITGGKNVFPYTLTFAYNTLKPDNVAGCPVHLSTKLDRANAKEGDMVKLNAVVQNKSGKGQGMAVAIIGLPAGLVVPEKMEQLKDLARLEDGGKKPGKIAAFEIKGRELVLYWRDLAPDQKIELNLDLECRLPGEFRGPASRAYLYYQSDLKYWTEPLALTIAP